MNLEHHYSGAARYLPDREEAPHTLLVAVACRVAELDRLVYALLDTGSQWCILPPDLATALGTDLEPDPLLPPLRSRFGLHFGRLDRVRINLSAEAGREVDIEATCFLSTDWPGPMVIGWKGGLERIRLALDPGEDALYFARYRRCIQQTR